MRPRISFVPTAWRGRCTRFNQWTQPIYNAFPQGRNSPVNEYTDNLTKIHGNHTIKAGGNIRFTTQYGYNAAGIYPNASLGTTLTGNTPPAVQPAGLNATQLTTFQGLYNNLLGRVGSIVQTFYSDLNTWQAAGTPRVRNFVFHEYGFFVQDDWKMSRNLTLNLGLRWDFSGVPSETGGQSGILDQVANLNTTSQIDNLTIKKGGQWYKNDLNNFAPRFGLAWDPKGDGKTAVRANYGWFYDRIIGSTTSTVDGATPGFSQSVTVFPNQATGSDLRIADNLALPGQPSAPVLTLPNTRSVTSISAFNPNLRTGYVQMWGLNIQRQIAKDTMIQVGYLGNHSIKMYLNQDLDQMHTNPTAVAAFNELASNYNANTLGNVSPNNVFVKILGSASNAVSTLGTSNLQTLQYNNAMTNLERSSGQVAKYQAAGVSEYFLRNYPQFVQLEYGTNGGLATYNSFQFSLHHKTKSYNINANYTFSKSLDNISVEGNGTSDTIDAFNLGLNKARSDFDRPHVFNLQGIYTLPIGTGHAFGGTMPKWANALIGGWDIGGLAIWESGGVMTASSARYTNLSYLAASWDNYTGSRNIGSVTRKGDGVYFIDPSLISNFTYPGAGDIGNAGRNTFRGPRFFNVDASLVKSFAITEKKKIIFRAEAYNLFNNVDFGNPSLDIGAPSTFGKISGVVNNPRLLQGALRFNW